MGSFEPLIREGWLEVQELNPGNWLRYCHNIQSRGNSDTSCWTTSNLLGRWYFHALKKEIQESVWQLITDTYSMALAEDQGNSI